MAYYIYSRSTQGSTTTYTFVRGAKLYGRSASEILRLLKPLIPASQGEPFPWCLLVRDAFATDCHPDWSFIIDLRPNARPPVFYFFELLQVCGHSDEGWTPALLRLRQVLDESAVGRTRPPQQFQLDDNAYLDPIYTVIHFGKEGSKRGANWSVEGSR